VIDVMKTYNRVALTLMAVGGIGFWIWRRRKTAEENLSDDDKGQSI
jgi:hypothetical protein